jgi:hypothetical protein
MWDGKSNYTLRLGEKACSYLTVPPTPTPNPPATIMSRKQAMHAVPSPVGSAIAGWTGMACSEVASAISIAIFKVEILLTFHSLVHQCCRAFDAPSRLLPVILRCRLHLRDPRE